MSSSHESKKVSEDKAPPGFMFFVAGGVMMILGFRAPEFYPPGKEWLGTAIRIGFFVLSGLLFLTFLVKYWLANRNSSEPTDGPGAS